jgi:hypothetical protein
MSEHATSGEPSSDPLRTVAEALEKAVLSATDTAKEAKANVEQALPAASRFLSRFVYTTCYTLSYGVVFPTVLIAKSIPTNNAFAHGLADGAKAAIDAVEQVKNRQLAAPQTGSNP